MSTHKILGGCLWARVYDWPLYVRVACRILGVRGYLLVVPYSLPGGGGLWLLWWEASPRSGVEGGVGLCTLKHMGNLSRCDLLVPGGGLWWC